MVQAQQPSGTALHHHLAVIAEAPGQELGHHAKGAPAAFRFFNQAAAGGTSQGTAGGRHALLKAAITTASPLLTGRCDARFQLGAHHVEQWTQQAGLGGCAAARYQAECRKRRTQA